MCFFFLAILAVICNLSVPLQVASSKVLSEMVEYLIHVIKKCYTSDEQLEKLFHVNCVQI